MSNAKVDSAIQSARVAIIDILDGNPEFCPQFIRIAFYDAISYDPTAKVDGPNGSIRLWEGMDTDMSNALKKLDSLKIKDGIDVWPYVSYADLYQLAGVVAVEKAHGPVIDFQYGRMDSSIPIDSSKLQVISEVPKLVDTFHHIGFTAKEIVALSLAQYYWMNYTSNDQPIIDKSFYEKLLNLEDEIYESEATSFTTDTLMEDRLSKSTTTTSPLRRWKCFLLDPSLHKHVKIFVKDPNTIQKEYASAHKKLSELGFKQFPQRTPTEVEYQGMKHGTTFAVAMTILVCFLGLVFEAMRV